MRKEDFTLRQLLAQTYQQWQEEDGDYSTSPFVYAEDCSFCENAPVAVQCTARGYVPAGDIEGWLAHVQTLPPCTILVQDYAGDKGCEYKGEWQFRQDGTLIAYCPVENYWDGITHGAGTEWGEDA